MRDTQETVMPRLAVRRFAEAMEAKLRANDHKPGWQGDNWTSLFARLGEEKDELLGALTAYTKVLMALDGLTMEWESGQLLSRVMMSEEGLLAMLDEARANLRQEACDVALFALFIADVCGALGVEHDGRGRATHEPTP